MHVLYIDEAGDTGMLPAANSDIQPVFVIAGCILHHSIISQFTRDFLSLKKRYSPHAPVPGAGPLDAVLAEIKGCDVRRDVRNTSHRKSRWALRLLDSFLQLLEECHARILGRVWVKGIGVPFDGKAVYTFSLQSSSTAFNHYLVDRQEDGIVIADSRWKSQNVSLSHSLFTQKFKAAGDEYPRMLELPLFGHAANHCGLQAADLLCSALLFPMVACTYCLGLVSSKHVWQEHQILKSHFGRRLSELQYRYEDESGKWRGGITVSDALAQQSGANLFR
jgi:hypothetical protein